jgi:hypothetical protein
LLTVATENSEKTPGKKDHHTKLDKETSRHPLSLFRIHMSIVRQARRRLNLFSMSYFRYALFL